MTLPSPNAKNMLPPKNNKKLLIFAMTTVAKLQKCPDRNPLDFHIVTIIK